MPIRTSIVTGKKKEQSEFLRFTVQDGVLVFDEKVKNEGRGGYVENNEKLIKRLPKLSRKIRYMLKVREVEIKEGVFFGEKNAPPYVQRGIGSPS